jgi:hypothetical protein
MHSPVPFAGRDPFRTASFSDMYSHLSGELGDCSRQERSGRVSGISCVSPVIVRPIFLGAANLDSMPLGLGSKNKTTGGWNFVPEFTPHGWAAAGHRTLSFSPGDRSLLNGRHLADSDQANAALGNPIAFFTALQIISREKGFWRKPNIRNFFALNATALAS